MRPFPVQCFGRGTAQLGNTFTCFKPWRLFSTVARPEVVQPPVRQATLFVDSLFPIHLGRFDLRRYLGRFFQNKLLDALHSRLTHVGAHGFKVLSIEPHQRDGGAFVTFQYQEDANVDVLQALEKGLNEEIQKQGGLPSWMWTRRGRAWVVRGIPWREDMRRFPSSILKVAFEGPDVHEQNIYNLFRPYGRIEHITNPGPVPAGSLRFSTVTFQRIRSATIVHNVLHGMKVQPALGGDSSTLTRLWTVYQDPIQAHVIRDWISKHPRIFFPVLVFLLGTLTYTIFDPVRALMVQGEMENWFDVRQSKVYKWLRVNALDLFVENSNSTISSNDDEDLWKERDDAKSSIEGYLTDFPTTAAFVHGPQGSGKTRMLDSILKESNRPYLAIDCREMLKASSDAKLINELAKQTGYWPVFSFLNSINNLIDLASVGLIGQKTGLSSSVNEQLQDILNVVASGLSRVSASHKAAMQREVKGSEKESSSGIRKQFKLIKEHVMGSPEQDMDNGRKDGKFTNKQRNIEDVYAVESLPIVVIRNFASKGDSKGEDLLDVIARWAATLAENKIAHVIVLSDNRENSRKLAKALPTKPLHAVAFYDADPASALSYIKQKLRDADIQHDFDSQERVYIERLGGRATDLESLIHKLRSGQSVEDAVEDIISRGVTELRKNAFGDDADEAKNLGWTRNQAWAVLKTLSNEDEVSYHDVLLNFPFKGDESPLRNMEHAELIGISTENGRPSTIRPGKPVFRWVFERLAKDPVFQATQDMAYNQTLIAEAEKNIKECEAELLSLKSIGEKGSWWSSSVIENRSAYLLGKMQQSVLKINSLEKKNADFKKVLAKRE